MENKSEYAKAMAVILEMAKANKDAKIQAAVAVIEAGRPHGVRKENPVLAMFNKIGDTVHEDQLFAKVKMGRKDMYWLVADQIKEGDKATRKWIGFSEPTGLYKLYGIGKEIPTGYTGYVPKDERVTTKTVVVAKK